MPDHGDEARRLLLEEGARSYLDAISALIEFQKEVQKKCRSVMQRHIKDYGAALKIPLRPSDIQDAAWPKLEKWEGDYWHLGVSIVRRDIPGVRWWEGYYCLGFEAPNPGFCCWIGEWYPRKMATHLFRKFRRFHPKASMEVEDGKTIWINQRLKPEETSGFEEKLEELLEEWIRLWTKVGGIKEAFKP